MNKFGRISISAGNDFYGILVFDSDYMATTINLDMISQIINYALSKRLDKIFDEKHRKECVVAACEMMFLGFDNKTKTYENWSCYTRLSSKSLDCYKKFGGKKSYKAPSENHIYTFVTLDEISASLAEEPFDISINIDFEKKEIKGLYSLLVKYHTQHEKNIAAFEAFLRNDKYLKDCIDFWDDLISQEAVERENKFYNMVEKMAKGIKFNDFNEVNEYLSKFKPYKYMRLKRRSLPSVLATNLEKGTIISKRYA